MKSKLVLLLVVILIASCGGGIQRTTIKDSDIEKALEQFTSHRINHHLYSTDVPPDNETIMIYVIQQHGLSVHSFMEKLRQSKPEIFHSLFG